MRSKTTLVGGRLILTKYPPTCGKGVGVKLRGRPLKGLRPTINASARKETAEVVAEGSAQGVPEFDFE
jgi:hypothetical protein